MATFLSKVFPRKKDKDGSNKRNSSSSLLEGRFEAVSPTVSPSAANFAESAQQPKERGREKDKEKEGGFTIFRSKSRPTSPPPDMRKSVSDVPHLTLNLPVPKEERSRALGVVFEADPNDTSTLPDNVIGERRLNPLETLLLVKACSTAIIDHGGLETLGVMHPFWYSASPEIQRKLISLFILSLASKSPITTLSPSPTAAVTNFNYELEYTRSPHDIAAVLRWGLRHLRLEGDSFGRVSDSWGWYQTFADAERTSSYRPSAFTDALVPQLPPSHHQLLVATLEIVSSLAAHSEHNGISGSKLSKFFGLWLLSTQRSEAGEDWTSFYLRWERAGRILEHLFLAHIRDEMVRKKMPLRLAELVKGYPYHNRTSSTDTAPAAGDDLLPRPRFSTRQYSALLVRVETELPDAKATKPKPHPLRLITDALKSDIELTDSQFKVVWEAIRKAALVSDEPEPILSNVDGFPSLSRIFADETTRLLSLVPAESTGAVSIVPTIRLPRPPRRRSSSLNSSTQPQPHVNGNGKAPTNGNAKIDAAPPTSPGSPKDWMDFSSAGFGESTLGKDFAKTLLDKDVEVTSPKDSVGRKTSKKRKLSPRRSSVDNPDPGSATRAAAFSAGNNPKTKTTFASVIKLDEAFIDFWSDALADPISSNWPNFVVAQLKAIPGVKIDGKPVGWLVLEQRFVPPPRPPTTAEETTSPTTPRRASSPKPSVRSEASHKKISTLSAMKKRFTFSSSSQSLSGLVAKADAKTARKAAKSARVGEMGEILPEVEEKPEEKVTDKKAVPKKEETAPAPKALTQEVKASATYDNAQHAAVPPAVMTAVESPSPTDALSPLTPTADDFPPVPVVGGLLPTAPSATEPTAPVAIEPLKAEDAFLEEKPVVDVPEAPAVPTDTTTSATAPEEKTLPPAPETVVLTGETPGPQVALSTSEPAALAEVSTKIDEIVRDAASSPEPEAAGTRTTQVVHEPVQVEEVVSLAAPHKLAPPAIEETPTVEEAAAEAEPASAETPLVPEPVVIEAPASEPVQAAPAIEEVNESVQQALPVVVATPEETPAPAPEPEPVVEETPAPKEPIVPPVEEPSAESEPVVAAALEPTLAPGQPEAEPEAPAAAEEVPALTEATPEEPVAPDEERKEAAPTVEEIPAEEPAPVPAVEEPVVEEPAPAADEPVAQRPATPAVEEPTTPAVEEVAAPAASEPTPEVAPPALVEEPTHAPTVEETTSSVPELVTPKETHTAEIVTSAEATEAPAAAAPVEADNKPVAPSEPIVEKHENGFVHPPAKDVPHAEEKPAAAEESQ